MTFWVPCWHKYDLLLIWHHTWPPGSLVGTSTYGENSLNRVPTSVHTQPSHEHLGNHPEDWFPSITSVRTRQNFQARALGDFHDRVSSAARAWGHKFSSKAMHVYMGENRFSLWSYHIGTVFKRSQLSFDIYKVSNHHLIHDIHQMTSGLPNLYKFQWAITSSLSYVEYWPENIKTVLAALWWLMWHSNTLQLPSESCSSSPCVMIMSHCSEGGFR